MTDEDIEGLIKEISSQIEALPDDPAKPLTGKERTRKVALQLRMEALKRMREAREKGNLHQETSAALDYTLLTRYGERPLLYNFFRALRLPRLGF